jgi:hypothetical protein
VSLQQSIRIASPVRVAIVRTRVSEVLSGASQVGRIMSSIGGASPPPPGGDFLPIAGVDGGPLAWGRQSSRAESLGMCVCV